MHPGLLFASGRIRYDTSMEALGEIKPAFKDDGKI